jgi:hypothetical protein
MVQLFIYRIPEVIPTVRYPQVKAWHVPFLTMKYQAKHMLVVEEVM